MKFALTLWFFFASAAPTPSVPAPASATSLPALKPPGRVVVAGLVVKSKVAPVVVEHEILAPIADELIQLGAKYALDAVTNEVRVESASGEVVTMTLGEPAVTRDGITQRLAAAPMLKEGVLLLPVMQLAGLLGAHARIDSFGTLWLNPTLIEVRVEAKADEAEVRIVLSSPVKYRVGTLTNPDRIYVDIEHSALRTAPGEVWKSDMGGVGKVRVGQFSLSPDACRVVIDLAQPWKFEIKSAEVASEIILRVASVIEPPTAVAPTGTELKGVKVVVDAGHGGHDAGATSPNGHHEKHLNLDLARRLAAYLSSTGATVLMTRSDDYYLSLADRCRFANQNGAHVFVSVHVNSWPKPNGRHGTEIFYTHAASLPLAKAIHARMISMLGRRDGGLRKRELYVTNHTVMPSTLTETAYLNHAEEEKLLLDPNFRELAAQAIALGVVDYARERLIKKLATPAAAAETKSGRVGLSERK